MGFRPALQRPWALQEKKSGLLKKEENDEGVEHATFVV